MQQLSELQSVLASTLLGGDPAAIEGEIVAGRLSAAERLDIHRNNVVISLTDALAKVYPVIHRLVGDNYFRQVARDFVHRHPPRDRSLIAYGAEFPEFLAAEPSTQDHPYFADVAYLEWACHVAFHAPDSPPFDLARLIDMPVDAWPGARICFAPSLKLIRSDYPIARIWLENQLDREQVATIELEDGVNYTSVARPESDVEVRSLDATEYFFASSLQAGACLEEAYETAAESCGPFDIETLLRDWMVMRLIFDISPGEGATV